MTTWNLFLLKVIVIATFINHPFLIGTIFKKMKNYVDVIGIDVSKLTIDIHHGSLHRLFLNTSKGYMLGQMLIDCFGFTNFY